MWSSTGKEICGPSARRCAVPGSGLYLAMLSPFQPPIYHPQEGIRSYPFISLWISSFFFSFRFRLPSASLIQIDLGVEVIFREVCPDCPFGDTHIYMYRMFISRRLRCISVLHLPAQNQLQRRVIYLLLASFCVIHIFVTIEDESQRGEPSFLNVWYILNAYM